ncbi:uncharacterized protein cfap92 isoform X2 [Xyrichtys novacula]|uniref:Uncharacterized protein cfap92 isoform X2 n=1 Tax=Xyrichtys novacula TaxID=13765 RepID=A0AAV1ET28_XYRNO|nr:uncharacterized protein cfap92 isoform X2 [Xyrichtys novacula]
METVTVESAPATSMLETGHSNSLLDSDKEGTDKRKEDTTVPQTEMLSTEHDLEKRSGSIGEITDDSSYYITWTVYIALAVPRKEETNAHETPKKAKGRHKDPSSILMKTHEAQSCYHIEYKLLPGDTETVKVDLVVFGPVVKIYKQDEVEILRTWQEGAHMWIVLIQKVEVRVDKDMLTSLLSHKIKLQIWNSKDKLFSQARYDRLKALRLPQDPPEDSTDMCSETKCVVTKLRTLWVKKSNMFRKHKSETPFSCDPDVGSKTGFHQLPSDASIVEDMNKKNTASAEVSPVRLLAGETSLTECFPLCSAGVFELMCNISLDKPLISRELKAELNPLVITILSATSLPASPVPFHVLQEKCEPVYCQYKFHNLTMHKTSHHKHSTNIYFRDVKVILTGLMNPKELQEFLSGPPLEIEVHDRDAKLEELPKPPAEFYTGLNYDIQCGMAQSKQKTTATHSYGICSLDLSELLLGKKSLKVQLPIRGCPPPPTQLHWERNTQDRNMSDIAASRHRVPRGHYFEANSTLKVEVQLAYPFNARNDSCKVDTHDKPFGRIVYLLNHNNSSVVNKLRSEILRINVSAFNLGSRSLENIETALSNYIMNFKLHESQDLDFVTGFHVLDKRTHIFVLEGLRHKAVKRLWEAVPMKLSGSTEEQVIVLYNSNMSFFKRLYESLDLSLSPICLYEPLETIMRQPVIYIRGTVSPPCFQALTRLSQLCQAKQLKDVVQCNLFPAADMILSMSKECGLTDNQWRQKADAKTETEIDIPTQPVQIRRDAPLDINNRDNMIWKRTNQQSPRKQFKNFIEENIKKVHEDSKQLQKPEAAVLRMDQNSDRPVHNYSIQTLNAKEQAMKLTQKEMAKAPERRFTYSQQYQSATIEPGRMPSKTDFSPTATTTVWISIMGGGRWNGHPKRPDEARVEELRKPWRENILHANILKPTLTRDKWSWSQRSEDFQLYGKPPLLFSPSPLSIHLAGDLLQQEQLEAARIQHSRWLNKLLPDSSTKPPGNTPFPRFKCHMGNSNRLQDILKDEPKKYSLRRAGMILKPLPQLSVTNLEVEEEKSVALAPGPYTDCSLSSKDNAIPRLPSQHSKGFSKQPSFLYKRTARLLTDDDKGIFIFQKDTPDMKARTCRADAQPTKTVNEIGAEE